MIHIDRSPIRRSSVTIRVATRGALRRASTQLKSYEINLSEQRLMRECLRLALRFWRGRSAIAKRNKKYNQRIGPYEIVPLYSTEALRSAAWVRCHHSGMSLSRFMDFAVANYLPRVVENWLQNDFYWREKEDLAFWQEKYARRHNRLGFVISYASLTEKNNATQLYYVEKTEILPWPSPDPPIPMVWSP